MSCGRTVIPTGAPADNDYFRTIIHGLDATVAEKDKEIEHLNHVIAGLEDDKADLARQLKASDQFIADLTATVRAMNKALREGWPAMLGGEGQ